MKYILILITSILLVSCFSHTHGEPIVTKVEDNTLITHCSSTHIYRVTTDCGEFTTNNKYNVNDRLSNTYNIDLPEEYPLISENSNKPDTLIGYYKNGRLYIRFLVAARNYPKENH